MLIYEFKFISVGAILQALVIQQTIAWGVLKDQPLFTSATGQPIPIDTLKQRLQFFQKNITSENPTYNEDFVKGASCQYTKMDAKNVVNSLKTALQFYQDYSHLVVRNMESTFGLLTLKGNLLHAQKSIDKTMENSEFAVQLKCLLEKISKIFSTVELCEKRTARGKSGGIGCRSYLHENNTDMWSGPTGAWKSFDILLKYQHQVPDIGDEIDVIHANANLKCVSKIKNNCDVPSDCQTAYLEKAYSQYMLTHQVLYLQLAQGKSCMAEERNVAKFKNWEEFREGLCAKVYQEAQFVAKNGFPFAFKDLFVEQIAFCGMAGFPNFMRIDWLNEIISWQSKGIHGCFPDIYGDIKTSDRKVKITTINTSGESFEETCLVHFSSISLSTLATHFRYMFDTCTPDIFKGALY